jgi:CrcB protein
MRAYLLISLGGIAGANARYLVSGWAARRWGTGFPYGTFIINVSGSFVLAFVLTFAAARFHNSPDVRFLVGTGFCGAYTTFSTFAFESMALTRQRDHLPALLNAFGSAAAGVIAAVVGIMLASAAVAW